MRTDCVRYRRALLWFLLRQRGGKRRNAPDTARCFHECFKTVQIQSMRGVFTHHRKNFFKRERISIGSLRAERVEDVGDGKNARGGGELVRFQTLPVAFAVETLVMRGR